MLKGAGKSGTGRPFAILGLSAENVRRLQEDMPIWVDLSELGVAEADVLIFAGETEESMSRDFERLVGPDTDLRVDPKLFDGHD